MSRTYHSKKQFKQRIDHIREARQRLADATDVTVLSTVKDAFINIKKASTDLARHPKGTKASGLRKETGLTKPTYKGPGFGVIAETPFTPCATNSKRTSNCSLKIMKSNAYL